MRAYAEWKVFSRLAPLRGPLTWGQVVVTDLPDEDGATTSPPATSPGSSQRTVS